MDSRYWLVGGFFVFILIAVSFLFILFILVWAWRLPLIANRIGSAATDPLTSRLRAKVSLPVPDEQDEDYLETRSYA